MLAVASVVPSLPSLRYAGRAIDSRFSDYLKLFKQTYYVKARIILFKAMQQKRNRDYAAILATVANNRFGDLLARGKYPKVAVLEGEYSCLRHD